MCFQSCITIHLCFLEWICRRFVTCKTYLLQILIVWILIVYAEGHMKSILFYCIWAIHWTTMVYFIHIVTWRSYHFLFLCNLYMNLRVSTFAEIYLKIKTPRKKYHIEFLVIENRIKLLVWAHNDKIHKQKNHWSLVSTLMTIDSNLTKCKNSW